jgi:hypothetical protein
MKYSNRHFSSDKHKFQLKLTQLQNEILSQLTYMFETSFKVNHDQKALRFMEFSGTLNYERPSLGFTYISAWV